MIEVKVKSKSKSFILKEKSKTDYLGYPRVGEGGGVLGSMFAGYVPLASQTPYPIIVYSVSNYRLHLSHVWANM